MANKLAGLLTLLFFLGVPIASHAGTFDDPKNLEVLPRNISPDELRETMKGISQGLGIIDLNLEFYPNSSRTYVLRAQILVEKGDTVGAREKYIKALTIEPDSAWIKRQLDMLDAG